MRKDHWRRQGEPAGALPWRVEGDGWSPASFVPPIAGRSLHCPPTMVGWRERRQGRRNVFPVDGRGKRPSKLSPRLLIQFCCIAVGGLEVVDVRSRRSWAKIVGTLVCLGGAVTIAVRWGPPMAMVTSETPKRDMIIGCTYLLVAVFAQSCSITLQAATLMHFPAPLSLCAINFWLGSVFTAVLHAVQERGFDMGCSRLSLAALSGVAVLGASVDGICFSFTAWSIKKKGPVIVSIFHPLSTIWAAILSFLLLGDSLPWGRYASHSP
ncbi:hypothetical protein EJ110_NYTH28615 [Nymphaea thermarum]|nr:hypothetical protein EJ110_NYTH28615 [Nymphaea thermarum]